ncbi:divalent metal cation transporter [Exilibacterium tricleocarpae]|uniref:Divalent metal cation transporter n=1 Tax=Exilibacterium tricleocarpae TaxID=2591008 RepID=A0A545TZJ1_9GAMM|nr:divalent metal cation transporter [Exilibacterium tricleocarpae]TQV82631.1 divalent metal cation transporter [Exilibacterium tricleocarpae]
MSWLARLFSNIVGPTAVMAAGTMGAGAVASFILAGAWFGYELLWVIPLMLPVFVIGVDSASRIGSLNPRQGMFSLIRHNTHAGLAWLLLILTVPVHILIIMGQVSVITSSLLSLVGVSGAAESGAGVTSAGPMLEFGLSLLCGVAILWLFLSRGYGRMQTAMSLLMVLMFVCFLIVAIGGLSELPAILRGFVPGFPPDLPIPGSDGLRLSSSSVIAMVGSAIAPAALLGMPYLASDANSDASTLKRDFRKSWLNLGLIFGAYAIFIVIAGGFALFSLDHHARIDTVQEAGKVLTNALPASIAFAGPVIFTLGVLMAAITTMIVAAQVSSYFCLDVFNKTWRFTPDNRLYHYLLVFFILVPALLAPLWSLPALLKVILLMGVNVIVIPLVFAIVIYLVNRKSVVGQHTAEWWRNLVLTAGLILSLALAADKLPDYIDFFLR